MRVQSSPAKMQVHLMALKETKRPSILYIMLKTEGKKHTLHKKLHPEVAGSENLTPTAVCVEANERDQGDSHRNFWNI